MIEEQALVVSVQGQSATLEVVRRSPCGLCGQTRGCGASLLGKWVGKRQNAFEVVNTINAQAGDQVVVGVDEKALLASALTAYGIPLAGLLAGAVLAAGLAPAGGDLWPLVGAGLGLLAGLWWLKGHAVSRGLDARFRPVILRQVDAHSQLKFCHRGQQ